MNEDAPTAGYEQAQEKKDRSRKGSAPRSPQIRSRPRNHACNSRQAQASTQAQEGLDAERHRVKTASRMRRTKKRQAVVISFTARQAWSIASLVYANAPASQLAM